MTAMKEIEDGARQYADANRELLEACTVLDGELKSLLARNRTTIRRLAEKARGRREALLQLVEKSPALFERPKSRTFHGVRVGYRKGSGKISWYDEDAVIAAIKKKHPDQVGVLINVTEKPVKKALNALPAKELRALGITVIDAGDAAIVEPVKADPEKLAAAFLEEPNGGKGK